jgi:hypothetical protein
MPARHAIIVGSVADPLSATISARFPGEAPID